jgi:flagella basal body P-ring formation protein FlgA
MRAGFWRTMGRTALPSRPAWHGRLGRAVLPMCLAVGLCLAGSGSGLRVEAAAGDLGPVVITLKPAVTVAGRPVRVQDVADVAGGGLSLRGQIGLLDLADPPPPGERVQVSANQVRFRIRIANIDPGRFRIEGARQTEVSAGTGSGPAPAVRQVRYEMPAQSTQWVAVSMGRIARGEALTVDNVRFDHRTIDTAHNYLTSTDALIGKKSKRLIAPGQVLTAADVEDIAADNPVMVKPRELIKIVARVGSMKLTALGEALQEGRAGQFIRVQNLSSKNIVLGRVTDYSVVEVEQ